MPSGDSRCQPGDLVGLNGPKGPELAVVESLSGSRVHLRTGFGGQLQLHPVRLVERIVPAPSGERPPSRLDQPPWLLSEESLNRHAPQPRDLGAAWMILAETAAAEAVTPPAAASLDLAEFTALLAGDDSPSARAATWLALQGSRQQFFRWRHGEVQPRTLRDLRQLRRARRCRLLEDQRRTLWFAQLRERRPIDLDRLEPPQRQQLEQLRAWASGACDLPLEPELRRGLQQAHCAAESGPIRHLLVDLGQWDPHGLPSLRRTVWEQGFAAELLAEAEQLLRDAEREQPGDAARLDLTGLRTYTLDDADTEEIDDALSLERAPDGCCWIWVHIADPGRLVAPGTPLDLEARRRASSLYLAERIVPMFPFPLATGPFSLRQGQRCAAWSVGVRLAADGSVLAYRLHRSWVRPTYRLTYSDGDTLLDLAPMEERDLADLQTLLLARRRWREARGALTMEQVEGRIRCRGGEPELEITDPSPARALVAEAMILTGAVVADHGVRLGLALPFRGQPPSELPPASELQNLPEGPVRHAALRRCLSRGTTGVKPTPHFSLGLPAYVQATSPIRRYADLLTQRQLGAQLEGEEPLDSEAVDELLQLLEQPLREGVQISREDQRHWQQVWFERHRGARWSGTFLRWLRPQDRLGLVHLEAMGLDLPARCPQGCAPGAALVLHVQQVDSLSDLLQFEAR